MTSAPLKHFAIASAVLAGGSFLCLLSAPGGELSLFREDLIPVQISLAFGIGWTVCVYLAFRKHGKRAAWLLLGFPIAWLYPGLAMLVFAASVLRGGGV